MTELTYETYERRTKKPGPTASARAKRRRAETPVAAVVRASCVERDGHCRVGNMTADALGDTFSEAMFEHALADGCDGPSEWAHLGDKKRAKTRNMKPDVRHTTAGSVMLCRQHHDRYDGRQTPRMFVKALTEAGADGPLEFTQ